MFDFHIDEGFKGRKNAASLYIPAQRQSPPSTWTATSTVNPTPGRSPPPLLHWVSELPRWRRKFRRFQLLVCLMEMKTSYPLLRQKWEERAVLLDDRVRARLSAKLIPWWRSKAWYDSLHDIFHWPLFVVFLYFKDNFNVHHLMKNSRVWATVISTVNDTMRQLAETSDWNSITTRTEAAGGYEESGRCRSQLELVKTETVFRRCCAFFLFDLMSHGRPTDWQTVLGRIEILL